MSKFLNTFNLNELSFTLIQKDGVHWNAVANRMYTMLILSRVELHLAKPGEQKIPTVIYSPLLYVTPPPVNSAPARALLPAVTSAIHFYRLATAIHCVFCHI